MCLKPNASVLECRLPSNIDQVQQGWNTFLPLPLLLFDQQQAEQLSSLLSNLQLDDIKSNQVIWSADPGNVYSVADAIRVLIHSSDIVVPIWPKVIWGNKVPSKIMLFHWLAIRKSIPVKDVLYQRHILPINVSTLCIRCLKEVNTINHLLLHCRWSFKIWAELFRWWNLRWVISGSIEEFSFDWCYGMGIKASKIWKLIGPASIWTILVARNDVIFNNKYTCHSAIIRNIKFKVFLWATSLNFCHGLHA
ncbi:uncharacterized protein [Rutidosis leptorrhynchoides]|uniref:uncharacterized protein n=1 Tax=Rutidosis leptorrhynchoides TaxID=125765 RepID=UPI003A990D83